MCVTSLMKRVAYFAARFMHCVDLALDQRKVFLDELSENVVAQILVWNIFLPSSKRTEVCVCVCVCVCVSVLVCMCVCT